MKNPGKIKSWEETVGKKSDLHPCPCDPACNCDMKEPCLGCETYGAWLNKERING